MTVSNIYKLLDKMEIMILKGWQIPVTSFGVINHEKVVDVLDKIRASIPGEIQEAKAIIQKRDEIFINAQNHAAQMFNDAKIQADRLVADSEILKAVQAEAERIRQEVISDCENLKRQAQMEADRVKSSAISDASNIREGADKYAETVLFNLDKDLTELHDIVKSGQQQLAKMKGESLALMMSVKSKANIYTVNNESEDVDEYENVQN